MALLGHLPSTLVSGSRPDWEKSRALLGVLQAVVNRAFESVKDNHNDAFAGLVLACAAVMGLITEPPDRDYSRSPAQMTRRSSVGSKEARQLLAATWLVPPRASDKTVRNRWGEIRAAFQYALLQALADLDTPAGAVAHASVPESLRLIGRDSETARLVRFTQELARGRGRSVLIEGEPGIGKSALVRSALAQTGARCQVFWGTGDELGQAFPLLPFLEGLSIREPSANPRRTVIVRLLRGEVAADRGTDVTATMSEQLLALIAELCAARPTVLVVDDLQWADQASIALFGRLVKLVQQVPLLLVGVMRPVPQRDDLLALRRVVGEAGRLQLTGISDAAVAELVAALAGGKPDGNLLRLAAGAAGNPLYVSELVAALVRGASLTISDTGDAQLASGPVPGSLSAAIADRLDFVPGPVREVLRAAALLGVDFAVPDLATILGCGVVDLLPAIDEARAAGVLAESGNSLGFRHPLIHAALYEEMPVAVRTAWHRDAGRALAEADASADQVARQLLQTVGDPTRPGEPMDEWMLGWLVRTADPLVSQAPRVAADLLSHAVVSSPVGSAHHGFLVSRLADALYRVRDVTGAEEVASQALTQAIEPDLFVDLHWTLAQCRIQVGLAEESLAALEQALASEGITARQRGRLLVLAARTHSSLGQVQQADQAATKALSAAMEAGDNWAMGWALHVLTIVTAVQGKMTDALPLFDRALAVAQADPALTDLGLLLQLNKAATLGNLDRYDEALSVLRPARQRADQVGIVVRLSQANSTLGQLLFDTGRWDEALAELEVLHEGLKEAATACCDHAVAAVVFFHRGEVAEARRRLAAAVPLGKRIGNRMIGPLLLAQSLDREYAGALPEALAVLTAGFADRTEEIGLAEELLADTVRLAMEVGDQGTARAFAAHAAALAAGSEVPHRQANALYCRGLLDHDAARLLQAAERYGDASQPLKRAKALEAAAGEFVRAGDRVQARAAVARAVEVYASLGAATDVARLRGESWRSGHL
ncbi:MAG TPA: AAA family ATPase [Streptosporangiaceae bacterium]|nr:AAA family ATPase [Streptosporangiaceae bacterium]